MRLKKIFSIFSILVVLIPNTMALNIEDVEEDLICACGCYRILLNCDCEVAENMRKSIKDMIDAGMEKEDIISRLQLLYGNEVLATPPKKGFFTSLWIYPFLIISGGLAAVYILIKRRNAEWYYDPDEVINEDIDLDEIYDRSR
jgi:cytochrome c-type biogenesis protein CcmH